MRIQYILPVLVCFLGFSVTYISYVTYDDFEKNKIYSSLQKKLGNVKEHINVHLATLDVLKAFFDASSDVSRQDFAVFSASLLKASPSIQAVEWVPKILHEKRAFYEEKAKKDGFPDFVIKEPDQKGGFKISEKRDVYYPVYYLEPFKGNEVVLGVDFPDLGNRLDAIRVATETGKKIATPAFVLTQETHKRKGILIFHSVYKGGVPLETINDRHENLFGLVLMVLRIEDIVNAVLDKSVFRIGISIYDITEGGKQELLFQSTKEDFDTRYIITESIDIAGRKWRFDIYPEAGSVGGFYSATSSMVLFIGFILTSFITYMIVQLVYRRMLIEQIVSTRTKEVLELSAAMEKTVEGVSVINTNGEYTYVNEAYALICGYHSSELLGKSWLDIVHVDDREIAVEAYENLLEGEKYVGELKGVKKDGSDFVMRVTIIRKLDEKHHVLGYYCFLSDITQRKLTEINLKQANEELEEFAYRTSHDLRSPLISSISLLGLARNSIEEKKYEVAQECIYHISQSLAKLEELVGNILSLTKLKAFDEEDEFVDVEMLVKDILSKFSHLPYFDRLEIRTDYQYRGQIRLKPSRFILILENLLSNAIKYQDLSEQNSYILISTYRVDHCFVFEIQDNGLGIPAEFHHQLFKMFQRFHAKTSYGSGLGLYMMKKSADILLGELSYVGLPKGSLFKLTLPLQSGD